MEQPQPLKPPQPTKELPLLMNHLHFSINKDVEYQKYDYDKVQQGKRPIMMGRNPETGEEKRIGKIIFWYGKIGIGMRLWVGFDHKTYEEAMKFIQDEPKNLFLKGTESYIYYSGWGFGNIFGE